MTPDTATTTLTPAAEPVTTESITATALTWPDKARALAITDDASYAAAAEVLLGIKDLRGVAADTFEPMIKAGLNAHRVALAQFKAADAPLEEAEKIIKGSLSVFSVEKNRLAAIEQARLDSEARAAEEERVLAEAAALELEGNQFGDEAMVQEAQALLERPVIAPSTAMLPRRAVPAVSGISHSYTYSAQTTDLAALVLYIATGSVGVGIQKLKHPHLLPLLQSNATALNGQARSLKDALSLPGVRLVKTPGVSASKGRRSA